MQTTQFKLVDALQRIKENNFTIPNFQRKFKWTGSQVKLLIDSMARNYPIGSFLLLTKSLDLELASRNIEAIIRDGIPPDDLLGTVKVENNEVYYVLDGQQRLTSIARVLLNAHPERVYYFDLKQMLESFPRNETNWIALRKSSKNDQRKEKGRLIRSDVCLNVTTLEVFIAEYLESEDFPELKNDRQTLFKKAAEIKTIFERIRNYQLPAIILERDANIDSVCRVFETINTTGTKLDTFDLAVAKYYPEVDLHSLWQKTIKTHKVLREFDVNGERALQCLVLYRSGNLIRKYDEPTRGAILSLDKSYVDENWDYIVQNLASVYEWAKHQGARGDTLPNHGLLVTLAGAKACIPNFSEDNFTEWYFLKNLSIGGRQAGNYLIANDFWELYQNFQNNKKIEPIQIAFNANILLKLKSKIDNKFRTIINLMLKSIRIDLWSGRTILPESEIQMHHIFPQYLKGEKDFTSHTSLLSICNQIPILATSNNAISNRHPDDYIGELIEKHTKSGTLGGLQSRFDDYLIPINVEDQKSFDLLSIANIDEFVTQRANLIIERLQKIIGVNSILKTSEIEEEDEEEDEY